MLATLLLAGMVAAPLSFAGLVMPVKRHACAAAGRWPAIRRLVLAVAATTAVAVAVAASLGLSGISGHDRDAGIAGVVFANLAWLPVTSRWMARARLCWASSIFLVTVYLTVALGWTFASGSGLASMVGAVLLWVFELFAAVLSCAYLWEICEALGTQHWRRRPAPEVPAAADSYLPMISLHVPAHNEPPGMVIDTLRSLVRLDYPRYEVILIDDNTDDAALWQPVQQWCARHGVKSVHLEKWPGYKSGALNYALRHLTDPRAELIGVVDSDYQIEPGFLRACVRAFADPWIGFVQAPQDYRGWRQAAYYRRLYYSYKYFFAISQPSRNEHDGAIFAGTMGLIRRVALDELGGWDEWCITEDAELSLRLLRAGWCTIKAAPAPAWIGFNGAAQVAQLRRTVTQNGKKTVEVVYLITSDKDVDPATLAAWVRSHWKIENCLHWVRDVTYLEDKSLVRTGNAPRVMASLRSLAISLLRLDGQDNIAAANRHHLRDPQRTLKLLRACTWISPGATASCR